MTFDNILNKFIGSGIGEFVITDTEWNVLFKTGNIIFDDSKWNKWTRRYCDDPTDGIDIEWEIAEKDSSVYYSVRSKEVIDGDERYLVHFIYDISDLAGLFHDMTAYSQEWHMLSKCQSDLISALSDKCADVLPIVIKYLKCECAVLYVERHRFLERYARKKESCDTDVNILPEESFGFDHLPEDKCDLQDIGADYICCLSGNMNSGEKYGLYILPDKEVSDSLMHPLYFNVFKLYIENALLRERIVYENEHDPLTGLYNDGKFDEMLKKEFNSYDCITVFFFDVNYLKRINDTRGHQFGSRLIVKAAESIKKVCGSDVYGFRMGGDEFIVVAKDADENKACSIRQTWMEELARLNRNDPDIECVIACGSRTASAPYDLKVVLSEADKLMYEDKRKIKIARGENPDSR